MKFPGHKCGLVLWHNEHRNYYEDLVDFIAGQENRFDLTPEEWKRCIETDELWVLQWYPETPIGFHCVAAPTLEECLAKAN